MVAAEQLERIASPFAATTPGTRRRKQRKNVTTSPPDRRSRDGRGFDTTRAPRRERAVSPLAATVFDRRSSEVVTAASSRKPRPAGAANETLYCPRCKQAELIAGQRGWGCARWREGCRFVIWFETAGRRLTAAQLRDLITRGKTRKTRFRPDEARGPEDGRLVLDAHRDGGSAIFEPG